MDKKAFTKITFVGLSCVTLTASLAVMFRGSPVEKISSAETQYVVTLNKDNVAIDYSYDNTGYGNNQYAFFQLSNPGSYVALNDFSYDSPAIPFGDGHLYTNVVNKKGAGFRVVLETSAVANRYYDSGHSQLINCPGFKNLTKIEITLGEENTFPFNPSDYSDSYYYSSASQEGNVCTINIKNPAGGIKLLGTSEAAEEEVGKKLVIDQVVLTYNCSYSD